MQHPELARLLLGGPSQANELVRTPLGLSSTVLGVRCALGLLCASHACTSACVYYHGTRGSIVGAVALPAHELSAIKAVGTATCERLSGCCPLRHGMPVDAHGGNQLMCPLQPPTNRYEDPSQKDTGRVWVRYEHSGHEAPLEPSHQAAGSLTALG